jgi:hypothetical protein
MFGAYLQMDSPAGLMNQRDIALRSSCSMRAFEPGVTIINR